MIARQCNTLGASKKIKALLIKSAMIMNVRFPNRHSVCLEISALLQHPRFNFTLRNKSDPLSDGNSATGTHPGRG